MGIEPAWCTHHWCTQSGGGSHGDIIGRAALVHQKGHPLYPGIAGESANCLF